MYFRFDKVEPTIMVCVCVCVCFFFPFQVTDLSSSSRISEVHAHQKIELQDQISKIESKLLYVEERTKKIYNNILVSLNFSLIVHSVFKKLHFH
jgi:hypothetical protein